MRASIQSEVSTLGGCSLSNIISVSWGDHLTFGVGDGVLDNVDSLKCRMEVWREELGVGLLHWRQQRTRKDGKSTTAPGSDQGAKLKRMTNIEWDDFEVVPRLSHEMGMPAYLYVPIFDEGRPLADEAERNVSYHNRGHGRDHSWQSTFTVEHPEYLTVDRSREKRQWGVLSLAYPEVRDHLCERFSNLLEGYDFDGLFVCLRSQSKPGDFADEFGFNHPVRDEYLRRYGRDIWTDDFDVGLWRDLQGEYLTAFLAQLREVTRASGHKLGIGCARGDIIGQPLGNASLQWREWLERDLIDQLVVNQSSAQCPSMWIQLWPMHRGGGYVQDYVSGDAMAPLERQLTEEYRPALAGKPAELYVARQWSERSPSEERALLGHPAVSGLVYSSFRFDNAEHIGAHSGDWVLGVS